MLLHPSDLPPVLPESVQGLSEAASKFPHPVPQFQIFQYPKASGSESHLLISMLQALLLSSAILHGSTANAPASHSHFQASVPTQNTRCWRSLTALPHTVPGLSAALSPVLLLPAPADRYLPDSL